MNKLEAVAELKRVMVRKQMKLSTQKTYAAWLRRYIDFVTSNPVDGFSSEKKLEQWLSFLAPSIVAPTQNQAFNAVLFFYREVRGQPLQDVNALRAKQRRTVKYCPSVPEVRRILDAVEDQGGYPTRLLLHLIYGCGLRVSEAVRLRVRDVRFDAREIIIHDSKHGTDRVVHLPEPLVDDLTFQMANAKLVYDRDRLHELPVKLPVGLGRKYSYAQFDWQWFYVFPLKNPTPHLETGKPVRYHCLMDMVSKAMRVATTKLGLRGITPHHLRHSYATHCNDAGVSIRDIQEALGHRSLETTMTYVHPGAEHVPSPLEAMWEGADRLKPEL